MVDDKEIELVDSIKNSASNIIVAACFMSGVAFFDFSLFIPVAIFVLIGFCIIKFKSAFVAILGVVVSAFYIYLLSDDLSQLGLMKLLLVAWVCFSASYALVKTIWLNLEMRKHEHT